MCYLPSAFLYQKLLPVIFSNHCIVQRRGFLQLEPTLLKQHTVCTSISSKYFIKGRDAPAVKFRAHIDSHVWKKKPNKQFDQKQTWIYLFFSLFPCTGNKENFLMNINQLFFKPIQLYALSLKIQWAWNWCDTRDKHQPLPSENIILFADRLVAANKDVCCNQLSVHP